MYDVYLIKAMMEDGEPEVRTQCVESATVDIFMIPYFVVKTRDTDVKVRETVYTHMRESWPNFVEEFQESDIPIHSVMQLVENGLSDPDEDTARAAVEFLREFLLKKEIMKKRGGGGGGKKDQALVELSQVLKRLRLPESF